MPMRTAAELSNFRDPSLPSSTAADGPFGLVRQPNTQALGANTGAPPRTRLLQVLIVPIVNNLGIRQIPTVVVPETRENRFVILTAPFTNFSIFINGEANFDVLSSLSLPPGLPYEISLPGNQALYAVTNSPVYLSLRVQIASAMSGDIERRL